MKAFVKTIKKIISSLMVIAFLLASCTSGNNETNLSAGISGTDKIIATLDYMIQGCFGGGKETVTIFERDSSVFAKLKVEDDNKPAFYFVQINYSQLDTFKMVVNEIKELNNDRCACTTTSYYNVAYKNETINITDRCCQFNGYSRLRKCLFNL